MAATNPGRISENQTERPASRPAYFLADAFGTISDRLRPITVLFTTFNFAVGIASALTNGLRGVVIWLSALSLLLAIIVFLAFRTFRDAMRQLVNDLNAANVAKGHLEDQIAQLRLVSESPDPKKLYDAACRVIGFARDSIVKDGRIFGDGHIESKWSATLRAVSQSVGLIEHRYRSDATTNDIPTKEFIHDNRIATIEPMGVVGGDTIYAIRIIPSVAPGEEFRIPNFAVASGAQAFRMLQPDSQGSSPFREHSRTRMTYPSNRLRIVMRFPRLFVPRASGYDVWYGESRIRHNEEYGRASRGFSVERDDGGGFYLVLEVEYPILGLFYVLWWEPPADAGPQA